MHTSSRLSRFIPSLCLCRYGDVVRRQNFSAERRGESGSTLVLVALFVIALFGFAALTIDVGRVYKEKRHEQFATDAGAFAAANLLTNGTPDQIITEAINLAGANGVATNEIQNAGTVELGHWDNTNLTFTAGGATPYDAVRVPAKRTVDLTFAKVVGFGSMNPAVHSVAAIGAAGVAPNVIPFGVVEDQLLTNNYTGVQSQIGDFMDLNEDVGSGKQGKINFGFKNGDWDTKMTTNGCNCQVTVGSYPSITGNAQVKQSFQDLGVGAIVTMPVANQFDTSGNKPANVIGFIIVQIMTFDNTGGNWRAVVKFLASVDATQIGGSCPPPCTQARALVE